MSEWVLKKFLYILPLRELFSQYFLLHHYESVHKSIVISAEKRMTKKKSKKRGSGVPSSTSSTNQESVEEEVLDTSVDLNTSVDLDTSVDITPSTEDIPSSQQEEDPQVVEEVSEEVTLGKKEDHEAVNEAIDTVVAEDSHLSTSTTEHIEANPVIEKEEEEVEVEVVNHIPKEEVIAVEEIGNDHEEHSSNPPLLEEQVDNTMVEVPSSVSPKQDVSLEETPTAIEEVRIEEEDKDDVIIHTDSAKEEEVLPETESVAPATDESVAVLTEDVVLKLALSSEDEPVAEEGWNEYNASYVAEDVPAETPAAEDDGWRFYTSVEGYPYYYNEFTGQSVWAQLDENGQAKSLAESIRYVDQQNKKHELEEVEEDEEEDVEEEENEDDEEEEEDEEEDEDGDDEEDDEDEDEDLGVPNDLKFDEELEAKFRAYLRTPEGIAAVLEEQERIRKYAERKAEKEQRKQQRDYARKVHLTKKTDGTDPTTDKSIFSTLIDGFKWLAGNEETKSKVLCNPNQ